MRLISPVLVCLIVSLLKDSVQAGEPPLLYQTSRTGTVRIGLLITDEEFREPVDAVQMAIDQALARGDWTNAQGGLNGRNLELVVRSTEGPWGAGSKESVALVYEDSVTAMLIALDGRNAHLAEQVAAKSHLICISTHATDPTLTQAYVPWFLRVVPSDDQQSFTILRHIFGETVSPASGFPDKNKPGRTGILAAGNNDSRLAAQSFIRIASRMELDKPEIYMIGEHPPDRSQLAAWISRHEIGRLVITACDPATMDLISGLNPAITLYGTHMFVSGMEHRKFDKEPLNRMILVSADVFSGKSGERFREEFYLKYGYAPHLSAFYAYDAACLLLEGIRLFGAERESLRMELPGITYQGITGPISFDELGNRNNAVRLYHVREGKPFLAK